jgi:hypothetical protein
MDGIEASRIFIHLVIRGKITIKRATVAKNKTQPTRRSVDTFLDTIADPGRRADYEQLREMMRQATGEPAVMWGDGIVGFGSYRYVYASGREGDWMEVGFSPRKRKLTIYLTCGVDWDTNLLAELGPHTSGKSCLYLKRLNDVDQAVLRRLIEGSVERIRRGEVHY